MKSLISVSLLNLMLMVVTSQAQLVKTYGVKLALTSASQSFSYPDPYDVGFKISTVRRVGFNVGGYVEWFNLPVFSLISEADYVQKGVGVPVYVTGPESPEVIGTRVLYQRIDYVSIPILAKVCFPLNMASPYIMIGPRLDYFVGHQQDEPPLFPTIKDFKKTIGGGTIGIGVQSSSILPIGLLVEFRYNTDFFDAYDSGTFKIRNNAFDVWIGVAL